MVSIKGDDSIHCLAVSNQKQHWEKEKNACIIPNKTEISSRDTWECGHSWDSNALRFLPMWPNLKSSASTCAWSVTLELSVFSREKAFQAPFDLFSIWLTLLWTCPVRFQTILALLFQHTCTTCILDLVPSQHASSPSAFATAHSENEKQALEGSGSLSAEPVPLPAQCGSPTDHNVRPYRECTGGHLRFAGIQMNVYEPCLAAKGQALSKILQPLIGLPLVVCACFDLYSDMGCPSVSGSVMSISLHVFITRGWRIALKTARVTFLCVCPLCVFVLQNLKTT